MLCQWITDRIDRSLILTIIQLITTDTMLNSREPLLNNGLKDITCKQDLGPVYGKRRLLIWSISINTRQIWSVEVATHFWSHWLGLQSCVCLSVHYMGSHLTAANLFKLGHLGTNPSLDPSPPSPVLLGTPLDMFKLVQLWQQAVGPWPKGLLVTARNEVGARLYFHRHLWFCPRGGGGMHGCGGHAWLRGGAWLRDTTRYGQWVGGTHPTGMHSCLFCIQNSILFAGVWWTQWNQPSVGQGVW